MQGNQLCLVAATRCAVKDVLVVVSRNAGRFDRGASEAAEWRVVGLGIGPPPDCLVCTDQHGTEGHRGGGDRQFFHETPSSGKFSIKTLYLFDDYNYNNLMWSRMPFCQDHRNDFVIAMCYDTSQKDCAMSTIAKRDTLNLRIEPEEPA
jgi:hypothetical protein